ncbi:hypothetical protein [Prochlorococcus marinus]|uniref:hypothetical protein n=1 Tax=Prochlorococcus TaxID=1218 RepID=UPI001F4260C7|nr:hypothetical protein [Prochlorococcus marinus]
MTDLGILWKAVTAFPPECSRTAAWRLRNGLILLTVALTGCSADRSTTDKLAVTPLSPTDSSEQLVMPIDLSDRLTPLPSATEVQDRVVAGRRDPFQPLVGSTTSNGNGFILKGVLVVGGQQRALVQTSDGLGALCVGPGGRCPGQLEADQLLPPSWSLLSIDVQRGCITLTQGGKSQPPTCML